MDINMEASTLSAISISVALIGVSLQALVVRPYVGAAYLGDIKKAKLYNWRERIGRVANCLMVVGTAGQLFSFLI